MQSINGEIQIKKSNIIPSISFRSSRDFLDYFALLLLSREELDIELAFCNHTDCATGAADKLKFGS